MADHVHMLVAISPKMRVSKKYDDVIWTTCRIKI